MKSLLSRFNCDIHKLIINQTFNIETQKTKAISFSHFYQQTFDLSSVKWEGEFQFSITASAFAWNFTYRPVRMRVMFWIVRTKRCKTRRKWSLRSRPSLSCRENISFLAKYECFGNAHSQRNDTLRDGNFLIIDWSPVYKMNYSLKPSIM